jgi:hypothetical protein
VRRCRRVSIESYDREDSRRDFTSTSTGTGTCRKVRLTTLTRPRSNIPDTVKRRALSATVNTFVASHGTALPSSAIIFSHDGTARASKRSAGIEGKGIS